MSLDRTTLFRVIADRIGTEGLTKPTDEEQTFTALGVDAFVGVQIGFAVNRLLGIDPGKPDGATTKLTHREIQAETTIAQYMDRIEKIVDALVPAGNCTDRS